MQVDITKAGKKFGHKWVFKNLDALIEPENLCSITGKNGSGKSTLLLMVAGYVTPSAGALRWTINKQLVPQDKLFKHLTISSPYLELIEDFTMLEMIRFHKKFKAFLHDMDDDELIRLSGLSASKDKQIRQFSSGMKQRVKLLLAITSKSDLLLLDEPCSNLDADGVQWYQQLLHDYSSNRSIVIASNHKEEEYPGATTCITL
jgi:ABC-2 type transport system ATP-binding protein